MIGLNSFAQSAQWFNSKELIISEFHVMTAEERALVKEATAGSMEGRYILADDYKWFYHNGDLSIKGNLDNKNMLVVNGNLTIEGSYDDYHSGSGHLIVLGNVTSDHFMNQGFAWVGGQLTTKGLVYSYYNDHNFEVMNGVQAKGIIVSNKATRFNVLQSDFYINDNVIDSDNYRANISKAAALFIPDVYFLSEESSNDMSFSSFPQEEAVLVKVHKGENLFREQPATDITEYLEWIDDEQFDKFATIDLSKVDNFVTRRLALTEDLPETLMLRLITHPDGMTRGFIAWLWPEDKMSLLTDEQLKDEAVKRGLIKNTGIPATMLKKLMAKPTESVQLQQAKRKDLSPQIVAQLSQSPFLSVHKQLVNSSDYVWLVPDTVIDAFIASGDEDLRQAIVYADLSPQQAQMLSQDKSATVRKNLARQLAALKIFQSSERLTTGDIEKIASQMYQDNKRDKDLICDLFIALPESLQFALVKESHEYLRRGIRYLSSSEILDYLFSRYDIPPFWVELANNKRLPAEYRQKLWQRAQRLIVSEKEKDKTDGYELQQALIERYSEDETLLANAAAIMHQLPTDYRLKTETILFDYKNMPKPMIEALNKQYRFSSDWALSLITLRNTTRAQSEQGLRRWYENEQDILAALDKLAAKPDDEWWTALTQSAQPELQEVALVNTHTPVEVLKALKKAEERAWAINNPALSPQIIAEWLKEMPELALAQEVPDRQRLRELQKNAEQADVRFTAQRKLEGD